MERPNHLTTAELGPRRRTNEDGIDTPTAKRVVLVHRAGALLVAGVLATFALLGFLGGLSLFSTDGQRVAGLSSNGLLSAISLFTAAVLIAGAVRGGRSAGLIMATTGVLFLLSAFWHLFVLNTDLNVLAFAMTNVIFSIVVGLVLLTLGLYGRVSGNLPADNPYRPWPVQGLDGEEEPELPPATPDERRAEHEMRDAEVAVVEHRATADQTTRVTAMSSERTKGGRRRVWMGDSDGPTPT